MYKTLSKLITFVMLFYIGTAFAGAPSVMTFQSKIIGPSGAALEAASVSFRFTILDSAGTCVLYIEDYSGINMTGSQGVVSIPLGSGTKFYPVAAINLYEVFNNGAASFTCQAGGTFTPAATDNRQVAMQFNDGSGWQTLPQMAVNAVPFANYATRAESLGAYAASAYLRPSTLPSCTAGQALSWNGSAFSCTSAGGGGSTYTGVTSISNASGDITLAPVSGTGSILITSNTPSTNTTTGSVVVTGGIGLSGGLNAGGNISTSGSISSTGSILSTTSVYTPQLYGTSTASGNILIDGTSNASKGNVLLASTGGKVGIGTTTPGYKLDVVGDVNVSGNFKVNGVNISTGSGTVTNVSSANADIAVATGTTTPVLTLNSGTGANQIVKLDGSAKLPAVDGSALTALNPANLSAVVPVNKGGTNSSTALNNNRLMVSSGGAIVESSAMTDGQVVVGKTGSAPQLVTMTGDTTISNTGVVTIANNAVNATAKHFANPGTSYLLATDATTGATLTAFSCSLGQVLNWTASGWGCASTSALTPLTTKGDLLVSNGTSNQRLPAGTDNYVLTADSAQANGVKWAALPSSSSQWTTTGSDIYYTTGKVGIGTNSPAYALDVKSASASPERGIRMLNSGGIKNFTVESDTGFGNVTVYNNVGNAVIGMNTWPAAGPLFFVDGSGADRAEPNSGDGGGAAILIGTPAGVGQENGIAFSNGSVGAAIHYYTSDLVGFGHGGLKFKTSNGTVTTRMTIDENGNVGIGTTSPSQALEVVGTVKATDFVTTSDRRFKRNIANIEDALDKIIQINGVTWKWISNGVTDMGVIAQDVEKVFPEAVVTDADGKKSVKYGNLVGPLVEAVKALKIKNENLEEQLNFQNSEIEYLKNRLENIEARLKDSSKPAGQ